MSSLVVKVARRLLEAKTTGELKYVGGARSYLAMVAPPADKMPSAFVLPYTEKYGDNTLLNGVRQTGPQSVAVMLHVPVTPAAGSGDGEDLFDPLEAPRAAVIAKLLGWQPDDADGALLLAEVFLVAAKPPFLTYQLNFVRDHTERA